jgi:hypothetical protein
MGIDHAATSEETDRQRQAFDERTRAGLARHGALGGVTEGEAFKLLDDL